MTVQLPETLQYGKVVGRFVLAVADLPDDPDALPNAVPAVGTIKFTSLKPLTKETAATPPTTVVRSIIPAGIDNSGDLYNPKDPTGPRGIWLVAGPYKVSYDLNTGAIASHDILVLPEHDDETPLDLISALPPGGPILTASQYAELSARIDGITMGATTWDSVSNKPSTFPPSAHKSTHATGGTDPLTPADIGASPSGHSHDDRYYTETEVDDLLAGKIPSGLVDAKGDLIVATADNTVTRLPAGTDGHVLTADSAESAGVKWAAASGGGGGSPNVPLIRETMNGRYRLNVPSGSATVHDSRLGMIRLHDPLPVSHVEIPCTTAQTGATVRLVCYVPTGHDTADLLIDTGPIDASTTGSKEVALGTIVTIPAGLTLWGIVPIAGSGTAWSGGTLPEGPLPIRDGPNLGHVSVGEISDPPAASITIGSAWAGNAPHVRARRSTP